MEMKEENNSEKEKLWRTWRRKQQLPEYLNILNKLVCFPVEESNLISSVLMSEIQNETKKKIKTLCLEEALRFEDKKVFRELVRKIYSNMEPPLYLWINNYSDDCGMLEIKDRSAFNCNFKFQDEPAGLIDILNRDFSQELIIDFYEEQAGQFVDIRYYALI